LGDVRVHRGPDVGDAARSIQAKAFATGGEVFLPDEHGPTTSGDGRKILSHELTHVVQQRRLGGNLPAEDSAAGAALEQQAKEVGGQASPPPVRARPLPASTGSPQRLPGAMPAAPTRSLPTASGPVGSSGAPPMSPTTDLAPSEQAAVVARIQAAAAGAGIPARAGSPTPGIQRMVAPTAAAPSRPQTSATSSASPQASPAPSTDAGFQPAATPSSSVSSSSSSSGVNPPVNLPSADAPSSSPRSATDLDELAGQLYPRFRSRLRTELLTDRERSGRLFDR
ncbi:MAG: DUF4157 domain-containing protein, partial [Ilumatobacter sp.]|nr:DUF4157 domain-containing protein [Ilumatobacter sp.]